MADSSVTFIRYDERHGAIKVWTEIRSDVPPKIRRQIPPISPGTGKKNREWYAGNRNAVPDGGGGLVPVPAIKYRQRAAPRFFDAPKMPVKRFAVPLHRLWGMMLDRQEGRFRPISRTYLARERISGSLCCERSANQLALPRSKISRFARASPVRIAFLCKHSRCRD